MISIILRAARVHATGSYRGPVPLTGPSYSPIVMPSTPSTSETTIVAFGERPATWLRPVFIPGLGRIADVPAADDAGNAYRWYASILIEREINLDDSEVTADEFWLDTSGAIRLEREFKTYCRPFLDLATAQAALSLGDGLFFSNRLVDDRVFFVQSGREMISLPRIEIGGFRRIMTGGTVPDLEKPLLKLGGHFRSGPAVPWLAPVARWYVQSLTENDDFRRFVWSFLALEILTHRLARRHATVSGVSLPRDLLPRFRLAATAMFPSDAVADSDRFKLLKDTRDSIAHGSNVDTNMLPNANAMVLLEKYFSVALTY